MIVVSRRIPSTTRNNLHSKLNSLVVTSYSNMLPPQSLSTDTPLPPKSSDWGGDVFSAENRARTIALLTADRDIAAFNFKKFGRSCRKAAVLVPFCYDLEGRPGLLLNLRSENLNTHSGEISFPGGTLEPDDNEDPITAALRETHEELGIEKEDVDIWTTCRVFPTISTKLGVFPVVSFLKSSPIDPDKLLINPDEVDHAFIVPLEHLCSPENWAEMKPPRKLAGGGLTIPVWTNMEKISPGLVGTPLWGLTAFITHLVLIALIPRRYNRTVPFIELMLKPNEDDGSGAEGNDKSTTKPNSKL